VYVNVPVQVAAPERKDDTPAPVAAPTLRAAPKSVRTDSAITADYLRLRTDVLLRGVQASEPSRRTGAPAVDAPTLRSFVGPGGVLRG
jgi:hypothetical protein